MRASDEAAAETDPLASGASAPEPRLAFRTAAAGTAAEPADGGIDTSGGAGDRVDAAAATFGSNEDAVGSAASGGPVSSVGGLQGSRPDDAGEDGPGNEGGATG